MSPETVEKTLRTQSELIRQLRKDNERLQERVAEVTRDLQDAQAIILANKLLVNCKIAKTHFVPRRHS